MEAIRLFKSLNSQQRNTFVACFLGWALDALDFFLVTFVLVPISHDFGHTIPQVAFAITVTLMMRPLGAFIFGLLGDKFGRRVPLMIDIIFYSVMELLTAFAPNFTIFLLLRALFGIGMGGEWGLGASLAMESLPTQARGLFSGILQQGYAFGYLLAALVYWIVFPMFGWRGLFIAGALPALLVIYIRARVPESPVWQRNREEKQVARINIRAFIRQHGGLFIYAALLMTAFNYMSHGTQDLYATFLEKQRGFGVSAKSMITIIYSLGAICGGTVVGFLSQRWGRRRSIILSAICGMLLIPIWIFAPSTALLSLASRTFSQRERAAELRADDGARRKRGVSRHHFPRGYRTRRARQRILIVTKSARRQTRPFAGRSWRDGRLSRRVIDARTVALFDNRLRNSVRE